MQKIKLDNHSGFVELLDNNNIIEDPIGWTTSVAAITRGNYMSNNPPVRFKALSKEAEGNQPSRAMEAYPLVYDWDDIQHFIESSAVPEAVEWKIKKWGNLITESNKYQTTYRLAESIGLSLPEDMMIDDLESFTLIRAKIPMFAWAQVVTHSAISTISQSDRMTEEDDYWLPADIEIHLSKVFDTEFKPMIRKLESLGAGEVMVEDITEDMFPTTAEGFKRAMVSRYPQESVQAFLRYAGYHQEIWSRAPYYFKMKEFIMSGYANIDDAWPHFLRERGAYTPAEKKNPTQPLTRDFAVAVRSLLEDNNRLSEIQVRDREEVL